MHSAAASSHKPTHTFTQLHLVNINHWLVVDGAFRELLDDGRAAGLFTIKFNCSSQLFSKAQKLQFYYFAISSVRPQTKIIYKIWEGIQTHPGLVEVPTQTNMSKFMSTH